MLPSEMENQGVPKSVLRYVWNVTVLRAGLGATSENQVREFFHNNPNLLPEFERMNQQLRVSIMAIQEDCKRGLREYVYGYVHQAPSDQGLLEHDMNQPRIHETHDEK